MGIKDKRKGFIIAITSACALFVRYVKIREIEKGIGSQQKIYQVSEGSLRLFPDR